LVRLNGVRTLALGTLAANPFPDATPEFFRDFGTVVGLALGGDATSIAMPFAELSKTGGCCPRQGSALQFTLSCMSPIDGRHCGVCGKCAERGRSFLTAKVPDPTDYVHKTWAGTTQRSNSSSPPWKGG